jgi:predicted Zn-dependent protease
MGKAKKLAACLLIFCLMAASPAKAAAAPSWLKDLGRATLQYVVVKEYFKYADTHWGGYFLGQYRAAYGVSGDERANAMLDRTAGRIVAVAKKRESVASPYSFFVNPGKEINAFRGMGNVVSLNRGLFTGLNWNEDEIAFIVAHEVGHGQGRHLLRSLDKIVGLQVTAGVYAAKNDNDLTAILTWCALRHIVARSVTLPQEWDADNRSFDYAAAAGYNPGAGAAAFVRVKAKYGDRGRNFLGDLLSPADHPTNSQRIANFAARMTKYGRGQVAVNKGAVFVKGKLLFTPVASGGQSGEERAYLIAGNLARVYHDPKAPLVARAENGALLVDDLAIFTPADGEPTAEELAVDLNDINCIFPGV